VPVHSKRGREDIRGFLLVKRLIVIDPEDRRPVHTLPLRLPIVVSPNDSLLELINVFQVKTLKRVTAATPPIPLLICGSYHLPAEWTRG
jgi:hypothetical protein